MLGKITDLKHYSFVATVHPYAQMTKNMYLEI